MRALLLCCALASSCGVTTPLLLGDRDADEVALQLDAAWRGHFDAVQRQDLDGVVAIYAADAIYAIPGTPLVRGRDELRSMESTGLEVGALLGAVHTTEALRVSGNTAFELGTVRGRVQPKGQQPLAVTFHYAAVWQHDDDGGWRLLTITGQVPGSDGDAP